MTPPMTIEEVDQKLLKFRTCIFQHKCRDAVLAHLKYIKYLDYRLVDDQASSAVDLEASTCASPR